MTNENDEFRDWTGPISGDEVREINRLVIERVIEACDDTPFKNFDPRDGGDWEAQQHQPDLKSRRLFPTNGLRDANRIATELDRASAKRTDLKSLRMLTLRLIGKRPAFDELDTHLRELSEAVRRVAEDMQRQTKGHPAGLARPILTAIHIRVASDGAGHFDPHVHGIWHIADQDIALVERKLGEKFGQVWIDAVPIRTVKRAAYYIAQGVIDYRGLSAWPDAAIKAVWDMAKVKMFRKAGWFTGDGRQEALVPNVDELGPETGQDAPTDHPYGLSDPDPMTVTTPPQEGIQEADLAPLGTGSAWRRQLFPLMQPYHASVDVPNYTVRPTSPEYADLTRFPNLGDIQTAALAVIEAEQRDFDRSARDVFAAYKLDKDQVDVAIARSEAYFHLYLFHRGRKWVPTPEGVRWAVKAMEALTLLNEAVAAGKSELMESYRDHQRLPDHLRRK